MRGKAPDNPAKFDSYSLKPPIRILGIDFFQGDVADAVAAVCAGGLLVAPSGPGLSSLPDDHIYRHALAAADICLLDSGLLAWLWEFRHHRKLARISGYYLLCELLKTPEIGAPGASIWVAPTAASVERTRAWLAAEAKIKTQPEDWYVAPQYPPDKVADETLLTLLQKRRPRFVFIAVGGGPQEKLGAWLKGRLNFRPAILCTGAAIAFLTGEQARIPDWADRARVGWLLRCLSDPKKFLPRYWDARRLIPLYLKWGEKSPATADQ